MEFKECTPLDIPLITQLAEKIWREYYPAIISTEQIEYMLHKMYSTESVAQQMKDGHRFILAIDNETPVGYASVSGGGEEYYLHKIYVDVNKHRKGVGQKLLNHILSGLPKHYTLELTVNRQNIQAINFYFKNGFIIQRAADFDIGNGFFMNDFVMVRTR